MRQLGTVWLAAACLLLVGGPAWAATYYVDFDGGADANDGQAPDRAFQHSPGDSAATNLAASTALGPGDTIIFKGGVRYRGTINVLASSGAEGQPITFDGNTAGAFGKGRAIIDGSEPLEGWKRASADQCRGNPNWRNIWTTTVGPKAGLFTVNLCQGDRLLHIAQDPNLKDPFYQDDTKTFRTTVWPFPRTVSDIEIVAGEGTGGNPGRPYYLLLDGNLRSSAVVRPMDGGAALTFKLPAEVTVHSVAVANMPRYVSAKEVSFAVGEREIVRVTLQATAGLQKFPLKEPVTLKALTFRIHSMYPRAENPERNWGAVAEIQAYDAEGNNLLRGGTRTEYADAGYFTQSDPHYWDDALLVLLARPARIYRRKVIRFDPQEHKIVFEIFTGSLYARDKEDTRGKFAMMNTVKVLDTPGEYVFDERGDAEGRHRVYLWPLEAGPEGPKGVTRSRLPYGFKLSGRRFVTVQGFRVQKQGGPAAGGITARNCDHLVVRDNHVTLIRSGARSGAIWMYRVTHSLVDRNRVELNSNCVGIWGISFNDSVVSNNVVRKVGSTALDYYGCQRSKMLYNTVTDNTGVHANALTLYQGCKDILVEGNRVFSSNVGLTAQDGENFVIRNNIFDGHGEAFGIALWSGKPLKNVKIVNNLLLRTNRDKTWVTGIFNGNKGGSGYVIRNNVIDGLCGDPGFPKDTLFSHNIYTRLARWQENRDLGPGEMVEKDLGKIFVDPDRHDYRLRPGSPAIDAGAEVGLRKDIAGVKVPQGKAPDIGSYEFTP